MVVNAICGLIKKYFKTNLFLTKIYVQNCLDELNTIDKFNQNCLDELNTIDLSLREYVRIYHSTILFCPD